MEAARTALHPDYSSAKAVGESAVTGAANARGRGADEAADLAAGFGLK
jgi:hypothetical protein